MHFQNEVTFIV